MIYKAAILASLLCFTGCDSASLAQEGDPTEVNLVDPRVPPAVDDEPGMWEYRRYARVDLDGDGIQEWVVLLANAAITDAGDPAWDDGQYWEVHVEEPDGTRTRLYAKYVQLGELIARIVRVDGGLAVFLIEASNSVGAYEVYYGGPGDVTAVKFARRDLEGGFARKR